MAKCKLKKLIKELENNLEGSTMYNKFAIGITFAALDDALYDIDVGLSEKCNKLQRKILKEQQ